MAVLNAGIAGNRLLACSPTRTGESALTRFGWEVAGRPGVTDVILHAGTNDLAAGADPPDVVAGLVRFVERAHAAAVTDVSQPTRLPTGFDAGDGLHLSDTGYRALADAVDPSALSGSRCPG